MHPLKKSQRWLVRRGFPEFRPSAELMEELAGRPAEARRGIYVHAMKDGTEFHVGLSVDVVESYRQDLEVYLAIEHTAFLHIPEGPLESIHSDVIKDLRRIKVALLNAAAAAAEDDEEDSDEADAAAAPRISVDSLNPWLCDMLHYQEFGTFEPLPSESGKPEKRYAELLVHRGYSEDLMDFVAYFIRTVVPLADKTHGDRWSISCLAEPYRDDSETALFRLTVRHPELMSIHHCKEGRGYPRNRFVFTLFAGLLDDEDIEKLYKLPGVSTPGGQFKSVKFAHFFLEASSIEAAWELLAIPGIVRSLKMCAAHLMESGKLMPNIAKAHCLPLCANLFARKPRHPLEASKPFPRLASDVVSRPELDSAWLSNGEFTELLSQLLVRAAKGNAESAELLLRHANRHHYRDLGEDLMERLIEEAIDLQPTNPDIWRAMKSLARCTDHEISCRAAYAACLLRPVVGDDRLAMAKEFIAELKDLPPPVTGTQDDAWANHVRLKSLCYQGSILAGIAHTGDEEAVDLVEAAWSKIDPRAQLTFFKTGPEKMTFPYLSFALITLEGTSERPDLRESIMSSLMLAGGLVHPVIHEISLNYGLADGNHQYAINPNGWNYFADYAEHNREALLEVGEKMGDPEAMGELLEKWAELDEDYCHEYLPDEYFPDDQEQS